MTGPAKVAGIDRWRGGWIIATVEAHGGDLNDLRLTSAADIDQVRPVTEECSCIAIDMPMALPVTGKRSAETELRARLGRAGRSVFTSPTRAAIEAPNQKAATQINRDHDGPGISAQAWGLAGSIRELRAGVPLDRDPSRWFETHPETAYAEMNGGVPLASKRSALGVGQRLEILRSYVLGAEQALRAAPERVPVDDVLDAIAAVWSASRIATDQAVIIGPTGPDDQGFERSIRI